MPSATDIRALSTLAPRCPRTRALAQSVARGINKRLREKYREVDFDDVAALVEWLLHAFATPKIDVINDLYATLPIEVMRLLLGFLPQFDGVPASVMTPDQQGKRPGEDIAGIWWATEDDKIRLWNDHVGSEDPASRLFFLLSRIESLQWDTGSEFGIIDSLGNFVSRWGEVPYLQGRILPLSHVSLYFCCPTLPRAKKEGLAEYIGKEMGRCADELVYLGLAIAAALCKNAMRFSRELQEDSNAAVLHALLGVLSPELVQWVPSTRHEETKALRRRNSQEAAQPISQADGQECSGLISTLRSPWGLLAPDGQSPLTLGAWLEQHEEYHWANADLYIGSGLLPSRAGGLAMRFSGANPRSTIEANRVFLGLLASDVGQWHHLVEELSGWHEEWYAHVFDHLYCAFDRKRHRRKGIPEFRLRAHREANFYHQILPDVSTAPCILEVGIGYGRLAKKLIDENIVAKEAYYGIDLSRAMVERAQRVLPDSQVKLGDMRELKRCFPDLPFDVVILAYTTFGVFASDADNAAVLSQAHEVLSTNGTLVLEQHAPRAGVQPLLNMRIIRGDTEWRLVKTSRFIHHTSEHDTYAGEYCYYRKRLGQGKLIRVDRYAVRLYSETWLEQHLRALGFGCISFWRNFLAAGNQDEEFQDGITMACVARKVISHGLLKVAAAQACDLLDGIKRNKALANEAQLADVDANILRVHDVRAIEGALLTEKECEMLSTSTKASIDVARIIARMVQAIKKHGMPQRPGGL